MALAELIEPKSSFATILRLENGGVSLTLEWMEKLAKALKCEPWELLPMKWHPKSETIDDPERLLATFLVVNAYFDSKKKGKFSAKEKLIATIKLYNGGVGKPNNIQLESEEFNTALKLVANG